MYHSEDKNESETVHIPQVIIGLQQLERYSDDCAEYFTKFVKPRNPSNG